MLTTEIASQCQKIEDYSYFIAPLAMTPNKVNRNGPWVSQLFQKDKIRYQERYFHQIKKDQDPWKKDGKNDELIIIPDGPFLRKYLSFLEDLLKRFPSLHEEFNRSINIILLESAAEYMDYRNNSPSISHLQDTNQVDVWTTESSASNERGRIVKLWQNYRKSSASVHAHVTPYPDLSHRYGEEDDFDLEGYAEMSIQDRSRNAIVRAGLFLQQFVSHSSHDKLMTHVVILTEDEALLESKEEYQVEIMNCDEFISFLIRDLEDGDLSEGKNDGMLTEHWYELCNQCKDTYEQRNLPPTVKNDGPENDPSGHRSYLSESQVQEGLLQKRFFKGKLDVTRINSKESYVTVQSKDGARMKYFLNELHGHFNRAIHEDTVIIEPLPETEWEQPVGKYRLVFESQGVDEIDSVGNKRTASNKTLNTVPTARVIAISSNNPSRRYFIATLTPAANSFQRDESALLVIPMDGRIPKIRIKTRISRDKIENRRFLVAIDGWDLGSMYPNGHFIREVGFVGDLDTEVRIDHILFNRCTIDYCSHTIMMIGRLS